MIKPAGTVIRGALIYDGMGSKPYLGDIATEGDRISAVGNVGKVAPGTTEVEASGLAISPGFIDAHTHDDRIVLDAPDMLPKISQGVTTVIVGNCGISLAPVVFDRSPPPPMNLLGGKEAYVFPTFARYAEAIKMSPPSVNVAALIGHSALRLAVLKDITRKASPGEITLMQTRRLQTGRQVSQADYSTPPMPLRMKTKLPKLLHASRSTAVSMQPTCAMSSTMCLTA
jgi:N-acyl-D-amino-acid deacylase